MYRTVSHIFCGTLKITITDFRSTSASASYSNILSFRLFSSATRTGCCRHRSHVSLQIGDVCLSLSTLNHSQAALSRRWMEEIWDPNPKQIGPVCYVCSKKAARFADGRQMCLFVMLPVAGSSKAM